ncbi:hypothetical protein RYX36_011654 [Vicia faba]
MDVENCNCLGSRNRNTLSSYERIDHDPINFDDGYINDLDHFSCSFSARFAAPSSKNCVKNIQVMNDES